jgi:soluble lytic murein transglycosylase-like protein
MDLFLLGTTRHPMLGQRSRIRTLGEAKVAIKNGFVVSAKDSAGRTRWRADERKPSKPAWYPRALTHLFVLAVALPPLTITVAQAHGAPVQRQRIVLQSTVQDRPENIRAIPADPPPPPPPPPPAPPPPPPVPVRPKVVYATGPIADIIRAAAARHGVDANTLLRVAMCESGLNPNSYNARSGASGLFQFKPTTYAAHGGHNIWDPVEQADIAAKMFSQGLASAWTCK